MIKNESTNDELLFRLYPNLANNSVNMDFENLTSSEIDIKIYDLLGRVQKSINLGNITDSSYKAVVDVSDLSNGNYFVYIKTGLSEKQAKLTITK